MHRCGMLRTGPAEPMEGHDEAPFLDGRGLRGVRAMARAWTRSSRRQYSEGRSRVVA